MAKSNTSHQLKQYYELVEADAAIRETEAKVEKLMAEGWSMEDIMKVIAPEDHFILNQGD